jgi:catechol 2,3-dioxygenase-like lactoylglutathione lyase family enzyme
VSLNVLLRPSGLDRSPRFYRDVLGLAICREFRAADDPGGGVLLGPGLLELSGHTPGPAGHSMMWIQVRDVTPGTPGWPRPQFHHLGPITEPWGLIEMWIQDPDGIQIVLAGVPADHPPRRDPRSASPPR